MKTIIETDLELVALGKLIAFVKYDCHDSDCLLFAGSPIINGIYEKVIENRRKYYTDRGCVIPDEDEYSIEKNSMIADAVKRNIMMTKNWHELSNEIKEEYVKDLIRPYYFKEETVKSLIKERDIIN